MNSLNRFRPAKQFRCLPLVGKTAPFGYEQIVRAPDGCHNYPAGVAMVGAFTAMNEQGRKEWLKLTDGSEIKEVSPCGLSAGSQKRAALSICAPVTRMSASVHSISSKQNSGK